MERIRKTVSGRLSLIVASGEELLVLTTLRGETTATELDGADIAALILDRHSLIDGLAFEVPPAIEIIERSIALDGRSRALQRTNWLFDRPVSHFLSEMADLAPAGGLVVFDRSWEKAANDPTATGEG